ncbi:MAG: iron-sulfur cluster assembly scaffold protein [Candidatus Lokiarchaeota archaeon]|nr:iron-sulfur cluster assembly scaffold protein [Candidatus Lokiarchaeota archaeon]MBD3342508.1 iron-sulfur cluster assembly scaffold protein [Candidatus Lokiarchaeota archaeon]
MDNRESKTEFDKFVDQLQEEIYQQELKDYNERIVELFHDPPNWGKLPDGENVYSIGYRGPCGDLMQFFLEIENDTIKQAKFITDGCGASVAAGSQTTLMIDGKSIDSAAKLTPKDVDNALDGLPADHKHCAELTIRTLKRLIKKYKNNKE